MSLYSWIVDLIYVHDSETIYVPWYVLRTMLRTNSTSNQDKTLVPPYYFTGTNVYELYYKYNVRQDRVPNLVILLITRAREPELTLVV